MGTMTESSSGVVAADLVFVGFNRRVAALHRDTGEIVWEWKAPSGSGFVALLLDGERLVASVNGYTYCLDPATGDELWMNPMTGFGYGVPCLVSFRGGSSLAVSMLGEAQRKKDEDDSSSSSAGMTHGG